jgi:PhzF family phenazine biosynthesis protein
MRRFAQVDVFTEVPGLGNPVAVVIDAEGLNYLTMGRIAAWTNLSETTFVLPPTEAGADYRVRIFTPRQELPMAGHPTLGTCRALLDAGLLEETRDVWVQQTAAGPIEIRREEGRLRFAAPPAKVREPHVPAADLGEALGGVTVADPLVIDVGPHWLTARVSLGELDALRPDGARLLGEIAPKEDAWPNLYAVDDEGTVHVRSFFDDGAGLVEDPVCGSGNAAVGNHLLRTGHAGDVAPVYRSRQGRHRGRDGRIEVRLEGGPDQRVWVGGPAVTVVSGTIAI